MKTNATARRLSVVALSAVLALAGAACGGDDDGGDTGSSEQTATSRGPGGNFTAASLSRFSLELSDLPSGYSVRAGYPKTSSSAQECMAANTPQSIAAATQVQNAGLQSCYATVFSKEVGANSNRPGSQSYLFTDAGAASRALPLLRSALLVSFRPSGVARGQAPSDIPAITGLGDESVPGLRATVIPGKFLRFYFWRTGNVLVLLGGADVLDDLTEERLAELARRVDTRGRQ